ncbi:hypothetical protein [Nonomuraea endophytica]|uniref:Uncharacterized protein n=1 Tax=Nonomuraea endophytica TaxID=714136 RepID=A0A7W8EDN3_9ACTN|nr:hypothetical protein [Nonomuraea endophytica]MBB5075729.1 hypothetical protein [Nonomuraea endophytica]
MLLNLVVAGALALGGAHSLDSPWLAKYRALEAQIGASVYNDRSSATLAWGESYIMRSYLDVYQVTQDTAWLDKLVTHADTVIANADDVDGDGFLGWSTERYSPVEIANTGFESSTSGDATLPASWTRFQDTGSHVHRTTDTVEGTQSVRVVSDQTKWKKLYQNVNSAYEGGSTYVLRGWGKKAGSVTGRIVLRNGSTTICALDYTSTSWTFKQVECKLPTGGPQLRVWLEHASYTVAGSASFDEVKLSGRFPYMVHDAMIGIPMAEFSRLVAQTPALSGYSAKAAAYRSFLETEIVPRWEQSTYLGNTWNGTTYRQPPNIDTLSHTGTTNDLPFNMALGMANLLTVLHGLNGDTTYLSRANSVTQWAKSNLVNSGGAYIWNYGTYTTMKEDLSHANVDLSAFLESYRRGQVMTAADMIALKNTLKLKMWNGSATAPMFSLRVDGTGAANGTDYYLHSWIELAEWDAQIKALVAAKYTNFTSANSSHLITLSRLLKWE